MNEDLKYIISGLIALAVIMAVAYFATSVVIMVMFFALLIVVCWCLGIIIRDILKNTP